MGGEVAGDSAGREAGREGAVCGDLGGSVVDRCRCFRRHDSQRNARFLCPLTRVRTDEEACREHV